MLKTKNKLPKTTKHYSAEETLSNLAANYSEKCENISREVYTKNWKNFLNSPLNSIEERRATRQLTRLNWRIQSLLLGRENDTEEHKLRTQWMTRRSVDLFGVPNVTLTKRIMKHDLDCLRSVQFRTNKDKNDYQKLCAAYEKLGIVAQNKSVHINRAVITAQENHLKELLVENYGFILKNIHHDRVYDARETADAVQSILQAFTQSDIRFSDWSVEATDGTHLSVSTEDKKILIGKNRSIQIGSELVATLMHEFVVHILRSVNGESSGVYDAQHGFDGYAEFEEGLGSYIEFLITGRRPDKLDNRQIGLSLAMGQLGDHAYGPEELVTLLTIRLKLLLKARGMKASYIKLKIDELEPLVIDRLFRGGLTKGEPYPVYTRDRVYAEGFEICRDYVHNELKKGQQPEILMQFLLSGKFDPTNDSHVEAMHKAHNLIS